MAGSRSAGAPRKGKVGPTRLSVDISFPRSDPGRLYKPAGRPAPRAVKLLRGVHFWGSIDLPRRIPAGGSFSLRRRKGMEPGDRKSSVRRSVGHRRSAASAGECVSALPWSRLRTRHDATWDGRRRGTRRGPCPARSSRLRHLGSTGGTSLRRILLQAADLAQHSEDHGHPSPCPAGLAVHRVRVQWVKVDSRG